MGASLGKRKRVHNPVVRSHLEPHYEPLVSAVTQYIDTPDTNGFLGPVSELVEQVGPAEPNDRAD